MNDQFTLEYAPSVIELLGIGLYKQLPQAIEELITNSWDADATKVEVFMDYKNREIQVVDNGIGMSHEELNVDFLTIAKNRRITKGTDRSPMGRLLTGKKGVGKLSLFGVANIIEVTSKKDGKINSFKMDYNNIKKMKSNEKYHPKALITDKNIKTSDHGTKILLKEISIKNMTPLNVLWKSLARRFNNYSRKNFLVTLKDSYNNKKTLDEEAFIFGIKPKECQFEYHFPADFRNEIKNDSELKALTDLGINGIVYTAKKPLNAKDTGFAILARGKLAGEPVDYQFADRANDYFYTYSTGFFNMDFIDNDSEKNFISTDRQSVLWDSDENLIKIRGLMNRLINLILKKWKNDRKEARLAEINKKVNSFIKSDNQIYMIYSSNNLSESDSNIIKSVKKILSDSKTKLSKSNTEKLVNFYVKNTEAYRTINSVYNKLIPTNLNIPKEAGNKIQKIRSEAVSIPCERNKGEKFIISEGLLFRALIDATSTILLEKNKDDIEDLKIIKKERKNKYNRAKFGTTKWICNLSLRSRLTATIQFLGKKEALTAKKAEDVYLNKLYTYKIIENLDMLMHDSEYYPDFDQVQKWWDLLCPILNKAFNYIKV